MGWKTWGRGAVVLVAAAGFLGCTTTRLEQREGCWVKQTKRWMGSSKEELGPCSAQAPAWSEDRLTRLVQECMAHADRARSAEAAARWSRGEPPPARAEDGKALEQCMGQAHAVLATEKAELERRLAETSHERDALRAGVESEREGRRAQAEREREQLLASATKDREHLHSNSKLLAQALGEAAKKPAPSATATASATGSGNASTQNESSTAARASDARTRSKTQRQAPVRGPTVARPVSAEAAPACAPGTVPQKAAFLAEAAADRATPEVKAPTVACAPTADAALLPLAQPAAAVPVEPAAVGGSGPVDPALATPPAPATR